MFKTKGAAVGADIDFSIVLTRDAGIVHASTVSIGIEFQMK